MKVIAAALRAWFFKHRFMAAATIPFFVAAIAWSLTNVWLSELSRVSRLSNSDFQSISSITSGDCSQRTNALAAFVPESRLGFVLKSTALRGLYAGTPQFKPCMSSSEYQEALSVLVEDAQHHVRFSWPWDAQRWVGTLSDSDSFMKLLTVTPDEACLLEVMRTASKMRAPITYAQASVCASLVVVESPSVFSRIRHFFEKMLGG